MDRATEDLMSTAPRNLRPLPPEISFNPTTGIFSGKAAPGLSVRLTSSATPELRRTTTDAEGNWKIALGKAPRMYTMFKLWTCDAATGTGSETIQYTVGGSHPTFEDVYASRTVAFGYVKNGTEINVYGPAGEHLGQTFVLGTRGSWSVKFHKPLNSGDRICIIARILGGDTSLPLFTTAKAFSVDDRNVGHIAGSGARPGDRIQLFAEDGNMLGDTAATESGAWSFSFCKALEVGQRIHIRRNHADGTSTNGPIILTDVVRTLVPDIDAFSGSALGGAALSGLLVECRQFRDKTLRKKTEATADKNNRWQTSNVFEDVKAGDLFVAITRSADKTQDSLIYSAVRLDESRPNVPLISSIDQDGASGTGEAGQFIVISTADQGVIQIQLISDNGTWSVDWTGSVRSLPTTTLVYFMQFETLENGLYSPTSHYATRYADPAGVLIIPPVILRYRDGQFHGTEATPDVGIRMYNHVDQMAINPTELAPVKNDAWSLLPEYPPAVGDIVYAEAVGTSGNILGVNSEPSNDFTVENPTTGKVPYPPEIDGVLTNLIVGTAQQGTYITLTLQVGSSTPKVFPPVKTTDRNWQVDIGTAASSGNVFSATASFGQNGDPSDAFVRVLGQSQSGFLLINSVSETAVAGTAPQEGQIIMGWRSSDGKQIVNQQLKVGEIAFDIDYLDGLKLPVYDQLNLVSAFPDDGNMTEYNSKSEGYVAP